MHCAWNRGSLSVCVFFCFFERRSKFLSDLESSFCLIPVIKIIGFFCASWRVIVRAYGRVLCIVPFLRSLTVTPCLRHSRKVLANIKIWLGITEVGLGRWDRR